MAYDDSQAAAVRNALGRRPIVEQPMFGGLAFLSAGRMVCGVRNDELILRLGPERAKRVLAEEGTAPFVVNGREFRGWVVASATACGGVNLRRWVEWAADFAASLPPK